MRAIRPILAATQIYNDYGPLPPADLLRRYGYLTPGYAPYTVVELPTSLLLSVCADVVPENLHFEAALQQKKIAHLESHGVWDEDAFEVCYPTAGASGFGEELLVSLETLLMGGKEFEVTEKKDGLPKGRLVGRSGVRMVLRRTLELVGKGYQTSVEDDEEILRSGVQGRRRLAVMVRLEEKKVVRKGLGEVGEQEEGILGKRKGEEEGNPQADRKRRAA
jgi:SET domain-containing protein 6